MFPNINPTTTAAWNALSAHAGQMKQVHMKELFAQDADRFQKYSHRFNDVLVDFSKNIVTEETLRHLVALANECRLPDAIRALFEGELINQTEHRSVLHVALRNFSGQPVYSEGKDVMPDVKAVQEQMKIFCTRVHDGDWRGYTGKKIKYIVNIGIGGSDLG
ncbi:MAG TPA: glucose-6-phosphate isomerase, partial [Flavisolibacter sp.]|nr:glucose-6-phosphate isomerase [Flavisolibacter sp.]